MPEISVIVPIYNVESYIAQCLKSIVNQTFSDIEILCIDDCGNDNSMNIVKDYAANDTRIKIIKLETNKGPGTARNAGLKSALGRYISCIDPDDYVELNMLELAYTKLKETGFDSVWINIKVFDNNKKRLLKDDYYNKYYNQYTYNTINITPNNINDFPVNSWNKLYSLDFIKKNNVTWSDRLLYEDLEFYYRFYTKSEKVYFIDIPLYVYRLRDNSILQNEKMDNSNRKDIFKVIEKIYIYLNEEKIFEKYKNPFIGMLVQSIERSYNINYIMPTVIDLLKKIDFPCGYEKNDFHYFLKYFRKYSQSSKLKRFFYRCYYNFIYFILTKTIPICKYRKKYRKKYKKYVFRVCLY
ncbi:MAG: glycosyltransferase [Endomicrobium sp.]|nr:glycosyltransferase [Endomicrobium sp.]